MPALRALLAAALAMAVIPHPAGAAVSTGAPAALLVFPLISVDPASGTDSLIQLSNTDDTEVAVRCVYENPAAGPAFVPFRIRLIADQPVAWRASRGLAAVPGGGGSIPALSTFAGLLRCTAVDAGDQPAERNVLVGSATVERFVAGPPAAVDSAAYNATGIDALPGASNGDDQLVLGGPTAEYAACPASVVLQSFLDGAVLDLGANAVLHRELSTTLVLVTCAQDPTGGAIAALDLTLTNEFGQEFAAPRLLREQLIVPLSRLDTDNPSQSIFSVGTQGSLTGTIRITPRSPSSGVLALALQAQADPNDETDHRHTAALSPQLIGERAEPDVVDLAVPTPHSTCVGDCNGDGKVAINELIAGVNIALGNQPLSVCPAFDANANGRVAINELISAVNNALNGC